MQLLMVAGGLHATSFRHWRTTAERSHRPLAPEVQIVVAAIARPGIDFLADM